MQPDDHRNLGNELDLFHFQEEAPGMVFWHPRGLAIYRALEEAARRHVRREGYREVRGPQVLRRAIWERSGHWDHFRENMFVLEDEPARLAALKPVSCPGHLEIALRMAPSFRDLPLRLAELGVCHRNERSGALCGLFRLRQFVQDDGHVFCSEEQIVPEVARFCRGSLPSKCGSSRCTRPKRTPRFTSCGSSGTETSARRSTRATRASRSGSPWPTPPRSPSSS